MEFFEWKKSPRRNLQSMDKEQRLSFIKVLSLEAGKKTCDPKGSWEAASLNGFFEIEWYWRLNDSRFDQVGWLVFSAYQKTVEIAVASASEFLAQRLVVHQLRIWREKVKLEHLTQSSCWSGFQAAVFVFFRFPNAGGFCIFAKKNPWQFILEPFGKYHKKWSDWHDGTQL